MTDTLASRCKVITELLDRYHDLTDPLNGPGGVKGDGLGVAVMPLTYTASVRELERLLRTMRDDRHRSLLRLHSGEKVSVRQCWWHVNEWHLKAEAVLRTPKRRHAPKRRGQLTRIQQDETGTALKEVKHRRNPAARQQVAERGVAWMAEHWSLRHEPMMPVQVIAPDLVAA